MIHFDHVNVFHKRGLNYHSINHTIIRVNGLIVTQNLYFLMELITSVILDQEKIMRGTPCKKVSSFKTVMHEHVPLLFVIQVMDVWITTVVLLK